MGETCTTGLHPRPDPSFCHNFDIGSKDQYVIRNVDNFLVRYFNGCVGDFNSRL